MFRDKSACKRGAELLGRVEEGAPALNGPDGGTGAPWGGGGIFNANLLPYFLKYLYFAAQCSKRSTGISLKSSW